MVRRKDKKNTLNYSKQSVALTFYTDNVSYRPALFMLFVFLFFSWGGGECPFTAKYKLKKQKRYKLKLSMIALRLLREATMQE